MIRVFYAVRISNDVKEMVTAAIERSSLSGVPWRWIDPASYHLTIRFIGETDERMIAALGRAGRAAAADCSPFTVRFGSLGGFPDLARPRVLFFNVEEGGQELSGLASNVEREIEYLGFERDKRPFRSHLTLARVKRPIDERIRRGLSSVEKLPADAEQIVSRLLLMRSHLAKTGAIYEVLDEFPMGPSKITSDHE
ncbi:MAG: RNA 2',3'-cyclic phosphodiesterase [Candidatus Krumholzibacteriota bacterium]|nr:RNA 2',3'-cyclic phosphodiesterase [Candidatus Krumholzibacteriota bacterium]